MNYSIAVKELLEHGIAMPNATRQSYKLKNSEEILKDALQSIYPGYVFIPEYAKVAEWLSDTNGKGLLLTGSNGRGKTIMAQGILPVIFLHYFRNVLTCVDSKSLNNRVDEMLTKRLISIDDIGVESPKVDFGERRNAFSEIMDEAEKRGNLVVITTNLDADAIEAKYGNRVRERIRSMCFVVPFHGNSLRK